eukprot:scaffold15319_cov18-Tisochrysis_lutea.AAC.1
MSRVRKQREEDEALCDAPHPAHTRLPHICMCRARKRREEEEAARQQALREKEERLRTMEQQRREEAAALAAAAPPNPPSFARSKLAVDMEEGASTR